MIFSSSKFTRCEKKSIIPLVYNQVSTCSGNYTLRVHWSFLNNFNNKATSVVTKLNVFQFKFSLEELEGIEVFEKSLKLSSVFDKSDYQVKFGVQNYETWFTDH